jgi:DHA1 family bicyclomycin/chloramphenicol resistance-like MFS transporter
VPNTTRHPLILTLVISSTVLWIAGTDLVLPAVPSLPVLLGGSPGEAQFVLAAFTAGAAGGLLLFGELGARLDQRLLLVGSLFAYGVISGLSCFSASIHQLIWLRFVQGAAGAAAAVFAPGFLRTIYGDTRAVSALGVLGSVESLTPALAPIAGLWLLEAFGWETSFALLAVLALALAFLVWLARARLPAVTSKRELGGYGRLLRRWRFLSQALSQAFTLAALLVFVFGAPTVITATLHGKLQDFVVMQICGITLFILAANLSGALANRFGGSAIIMGGTLLSAVGGVLMFVYAMAGGSSMAVVTVIFLPLNMGLGLRGPPGFHAALLATGGDDARGAALILVAILLTTAAGTAAVAPFIVHGLVSIAAPAAIFSITAVLTLAAAPKDRAPSSRSV